MDEKEIEINKGDKGIIDLVNRILGETIDTPFVKQILREILSEIDPKSASKLIKTLIWQDTEVIMDLLGAIPPFVNTIGELLDELGKSLLNFPPEMLYGAIKEIIKDIDMNTIGKGINSLLFFLSSFLEKDTKIFSNIISDFVYDLLYSIDDETLGRTIGNLIKTVFFTLFNSRVIGLLIDDLSKLIRGLVKSVFQYPTTTVTEQTISPISPVKGKSLISGLFNLFSSALDNNRIVRLVLNILNFVYNNILMPILNIFLKFLVPILNSINKFLFSSLNFGKIIEGIIKMIYSLLENLRRVLKPIY